MMSFLRPSMTVQLVVDIDYHPTQSSDYHINLLIKQLIDVSWNLKSESNGIKLPHQSHTPSSTRDNPPRTMRSPHGYLSTRGDVFAMPNNKMPQLEILCDLWHPETNPDGYVSLGVAENVNYHSKPRKAPTRLIRYRP